MEEECGNIPMVLVMTKMDLLYNATIDACEVQKLSQSLAVKLMKTSVKENLNISPVFEFLATQHLSELSQWSVDPPIIQVKILLFLNSRLRFPRSTIITCLCCTDWGRRLLRVQSARFSNKVHFKWHQRYRYRRHQRRLGRQGTHGRQGKRGTQTQTQTQTRVAALPSLVCQVNLPWDVPEKSVF